LEVDNPTNNDLKIDWINANVYAGARLIGKIEKQTPISFTKLQAVELIIPVKLNLLQSGVAFIDAIRAKKIDLKAVGTIKSGAIITDLNETYSISL